VPALSEAELEGRRQQLMRLHNQPDMVGYSWEILGREDLAKVLPHIGPKVVGASYSPMDGHVNSLRLFRALHVALDRAGVRYHGHFAVERIEHRDAGFRIVGPRGEVRAGKVVLAAGNGNARLAPMVGLSAPVRPQRGQIIVTEKTAPFLHHPVMTIRQTDEGGVMIGDSVEEAGFEDVVGTGVVSAMAQRAVDIFPVIGRLNVVRSWAALRVMTKDGFPIYEQSRTCPGAFVATCHSGVTLAANHVLAIAPLIAAGGLTDEFDAFSARRFDVQASA
jgi:glycine/D-amino acid oxidase-like deaminating enzyme